MPGLPAADARLQVQPCPKRGAHDWSSCPYAHPKEKARRRDPRVYKYASTPCPESLKVRMPRQQQRRQRLVSGMLDRPANLAAAARAASQHLARPAAVAIRRRA